MAAGIQQRPGNRCKGGRCDCPWPASLYSKADGKKIRQTFPTRAAAKAWRDDKLGAVKRGELRTPQARLWGGGGGVPGRRSRRLISTASGGSLHARHAPRLHGRATKRVLPALGDMRLSAPPLPPSAPSLTGALRHLDPLHVIQTLRRDERHDQPVQAGCTATAADRIAARPPHSSPRYRTASGRCGRAPSPPPPRCCVDLRSSSLPSHRARAGHAAGNHVIPRPARSHSSRTAARSRARVRCDRDQTVYAGIGAPTLARGVGGGERTVRPGRRRAAEANHAARGAAHLRVAADRRRREREGAQRHHGALDYRYDVRHLRPPDAGWTGRGGGGDERLASPACRGSDTKARGVKSI